MQTSFWRFLDSNVDHGATLPVDFSPVLVVLSFAVAMLAGYTALKVVERMGAAPTRRVRLTWLALGAAAMGSGIWAMHFVGMLAFSLPVAVTYSLSVTGLSLLPGVFASAMALHVMDRVEITASQVALGGLMMAVGIGGMHYLGMEAMRMDARMAYVPAIFGLSIVVAAVLATLALWVQFALANGSSVGSRAHTVTGGMLLGLAVGCMHYTAMAAARFYPAAGMSGPSSVLPTGWLAVAVLTVSVVILGLAIISTFVDRHLSTVSTSLQLAQQRARHIIDSSPLALVSMDENGVIVDWNDQAEVDFGWSSAEAVGRRVADLIVPERYRADHSAALDRFVADASRTSLELRTEIEALRRDGSEIPVEINISSLEREDGYLFIAFIQDITERLKARHGLEEARRQAEAAADAKGEFLANMSHEIRTPMNGVIGMTQLLLDTDLSPEQREQAEIVQRCGESLLTIINDILDFSKVEAGKIEIETIDFDVRGAVEEVTMMLAHKAEERGLELMCSFHAGVPTMVGGDPGRLRQILINLASNAIKFTDEGEVVIVVDVGEETEDHVVLSFDVIDTGVGIPEDRREAIFESFTQADASTTRHFGGTGLGLAIASRLVDLMGGSLRVESTVGEGSTFSFTVRMEKRDQVTGPTRESLAGGRILIVDDNATNRKIIRAQLTSFGLDHEEADGGEAAIEKLREAAAHGRPFEVALLDFQMPGMDGATLGERIKSDPSLRSTELVMLTSVGRRGDANRYSALGFGAYLVKPIKQSYLFDCLVTILNRRPVEAYEPQPALITRHSLRAQRLQSDVTILLAEDNQVNQLVAQAMVKQMGYACEVVENGADAVAGVASGRFSMVLMDCQMPEMDGYEATRRIRALEGPVGRIPIVAMTANAMEGDRQRCLEAGMDDYVSKPIDPTEFKNTVRKALMSEVARAAESSKAEIVGDGETLDSNGLP